MAPLPDLIGDEIADMTEFFERTKNPAAAWRVFHLARKHNRAIPESIAVEIDRFALGVSSMTEKAIFAGVSGHPIRFRAEELYELWRNDQDNPIGAIQREWRDYRIFGEVLRRVENGMRVGRAQAAVAAMKGVNIGVDAIDTIWKRLKRVG